MERHVAGLRRRVIYQYCNGPAQMDAIGTWIHVATLHIMVTYQYCNRPGQMDAIGMNVQAVMLP